MNLKSCFLPAAAVLSAMLLSSCASSERLMRISAVQKYSPPSSARIEGFKSLPPSYRQYKTTPADRRGELDFDATLVNIWPVFFRGGTYTSILWPMIDYDPYGFAVRPFFNQEGNEYSVLFPFAAWNPVVGDGWVFNTYWVPSGSYGSFPFFHRNPTPDMLSWFGPVWIWGRSGGFFPLASFGPGLNYILLGYWNTNYDTGKVYSGGFLPVAHIGPQWNFTGPVWWYRDDNERVRSGGFFPIARFGRGFNYATLAYWDKNEDGTVDSAGLLPVVWLEKQWNVAGPVWWYRDGNMALRSGGFFPIARFGPGFNYATLAFWGKYDDSENYYKGFAPITYFGEQWNIAGPAWWYRNDAGHLQSGGFFPLARFGEDINYAGPVWWFSGTDHSSGGFFPLARFSDAPDSLQYVAPFWYWQDCWGFFPAFRWSSKNITNVGPAWFDRTDDSFGFFPLFQYTNPRSHFLFPLYLLDNQGDLFLSPLVCYDNLPESQNFSILGPLFWRYRFERSYRDDFNPAFNWAPEKEKTFNLIGILGYAGGKTRYAWDKNVSFKYEMNSPTAINNNEDLLRYDFARLGYTGGIPANDQEIRQTKRELFKYVHMENDNYFGMFPMFHYEKSPAEEDVRQETSFRFLFFIPYFLDSPDKFHFSLLGPLLFQFEDKKGTDLHGRLCGATAPGGNLQRKEYISAALLSTYRKDTLYVNNDRLKALYKAYRLFEGNPNTAVRAKTEELLKQVNPELKLPASVTSGRTFRAWLKETEPAIGLDTRVEQTGGFLPILIKSKLDPGEGYRWASLALLTCFEDYQEGYWWFSLPLLSGGERTRDCKRFTSLPLLSGYKDSPDEKSLAAPFILYFSRSRNFGQDQAEIVEEKDIFEAEKSVKQEATWILSGLVHYGKNEFLIPKVPGTARKLSSLRREIQTQCERLSREVALTAGIAKDKALLAESEFKNDRCETPAQCRALTVRIRKLKPGHILINVLPSTAVQMEQLARVRKQIATSEETILALCKALNIPCDAKKLADRGLLPDARKAATTPDSASPLSDFKRNPRGSGAETVSGKYLLELRDRLYKDYLVLRERNTNGAFLASRASCADNNTWHVLWFLANGYKIGSSEETRVLRYLYSYRRDGAKSESLIFPFISARTDGDNSRWSFLWRVLDFRTEKGHTSGHILFIPFG